MNSVPSDLVVVPTNEAVDTSQCSHAISVHEGESISAEATHVFDFANSNIEDCEGGFELNNPFVQVMGIWFAVQGTGGVLKASSCPALVSVYRGVNCDTLECIQDSTFDGEGCEVQWQSSDVGQVDYLLVQNIEYSGDGQPTDMPVELTITVESTEEVDDESGTTLVIIPSTEEEEEEEEESGTTLVIIPSTEEEDDESGTTLVIIPFDNSTQDAVSEDDESGTTLVIIPADDSGDTTTDANGAQDEAVSADENLNAVGDAVHGSTLVLIPSVTDIDLDACENAQEGIIGASVSANLRPLSENIGYCEGESNGMSVSDLEVKMLGSWFSIVGTGHMLRASSCPARLTILDGASCGALTCSELTFEQFGCRMEWQSEEGKTHYILVQSIQYDEDEGFTAPISLKLEDMDVVPVADESPTNATAPQNIQLAPVTLVKDLELDTCQRSKPIRRGQQVTAHASPMSGDVLACNAGFNVNDFDLPVLGAWFAVRGTGDILRALACPARVTIYTGECDSLKCAEVIPDQLGCGVEWISSTGGEFDYILVETVGFEGDQDSTFPVTLLVEDGSVRKSRGATKGSP